jgi:hypothetical protein
MPLAIERPKISYIMLYRSRRSLAASGTRRTV